MLVLSRKKGQSLNIGDSVRIVVLEVTGDNVRIGIEAPPEVAVYRSEIYQAIRRENREAVASREILAEVEALIKPVEKNKKPDKTCSQP
ncbi:MAG: carbon storage regulator CsrA [Actinobacteria bacterium]|nr:carbon storage regulator CsrA [Actinomycetota bacterium]